MATVQQTVFTESAGSAPLTPYAAAFVFISVRENPLLLQAVIQEHLAFLNRSSSVRYPTYPVPVLLRNLILQNIHDITHRQG